MEKNMNKPAKSILDEAYDDARALEEALKQNAKDLLSATMKTDLEELVKESLEDEEDNEPKEKEDDVDVEDKKDDVDVNVDAEVTDDTPEGGEDVTGDTDDAAGDGDLDDLATDDNVDTSDETATDIEPMDTGADVTDMTQSSDEDVLQVFKKMGPEDGIIVTRDEEGNLDVNTGTDEFKIMMGSTPEMGGEEGIDDLNPVEDGSAEETDEVIYELDLSGLDEEVYESKVSPFDSKVSVNKTAPMGSPKGGGNKNTPYDSKVSVSKTEPMDNASPYKGKTTVAANTAPFDKKDKVQPVSEGGDTEQEMKENKPRVMSNRFRTTGNNQNAGPNTDGKRQTRGAQQENVAHYKTLVEGLKKENQAFKKAVEDFKKKLHEVAVFNSNLAFTVRLFTENSTTKKEKINILRRFDNVKNLAESKSLFESVQKELGSANVIKETKTIDEKITKTPQTGVSTVIKPEDKKTQLFESKIYEDPQFKRSLDIMKKINK